MGKVRVSCASLASIVLDGKYLLCLNKGQLKKGIMAYTPFGGALEYHRNALDYLNNLDVRFERTTPDLRFEIDKSSLDLFELWFYKKENRESDIDRELIEEMVDEENIFNNLSQSDFESTYIDTIEDNDGLNFRYFEAYDIKFSAEKIRVIRRLLDSKTSDKVILASKEEILNGKTTAGVKIGGNSKAILQ